VKSLVGLAHQTHMLTKEDFTSADWNVLRDTQYLVGLGTLMAAASGLGTIRETIAIARGIIGNQSSTQPFIRDLSSQAEMEAAQSSVKQRFGGPDSTPTKENVQRIALEKVRASMSILKAKASPEESDAYRKLIYGVAEQVANAASEGGFLGFGGTRVSAGEETFLGELRETLQLEKVKKA